MSTRTALGFVVLVCVAHAASGETGPPPLTIDDAVAANEQRRIDVVERVSRSTVALFERGGGNGGSGVIVSEDGLVVTNFHVTSPCGPLMLVGTNDGRVHDAVLLGLDPTGDIALARLLGPGPWPAAELGDSDRVRVGNDALVVGNPFLLADDFTPSVSFGVVSGVGRYQPPSAGVLEYTDCLQTDAAINPGNSGGPLFDADGRLIGINGRGSFEKRGRVNVGVGYAVSINQVKRFLSHLETGRLVDHASLGATVATRNGPRTVVTAIETASDAYRRGLRPGDEVVALGDRDTPTANALLNAVGVLPAGWRTEVTYRRDGRLARFTARLGALHAPGELERAVAEAEPKKAPSGPSPPADRYAAREGYANYAANERATRRLLARLERVSQRSLDRHYRDAVRGEPVTLRVDTSEASWMGQRSGEFSIDVTHDLASQAAPPAAPSFLGALWVWGRLSAGEAGVLDRVEAYGRLPWIASGPPQDVLVATHLGLTVEVYLDVSSDRVLGLEAWRDESDDRVRVAFDTPTDGRVLPRAMTISWGDRRVAELTESIVPEAP